MPLLFVDLRYHYSIEDSICRLFEYVYLSSPVTHSWNMRDIKPLLLLLLSIGLVGTWVYHLYDKTQYSQRRIEAFVQDSTTVANNIRDSLKGVYSSTIQQLDSSLASSGDSLNHTQNKADSLQRRLASRVSEINRLKVEISNILNKGNTSGNDMALARQKIGELQEQVNQLESQNGSMEAEKKQLSSTLEQLTGHAGKLEQNIRKLNDENATLQQKIDLASVFFASDVKLAAVDMRSSKEVETTQYKRADKLVVSFLLQNNVSDYYNAEINIVIIQPDKQVLQNPNWDSGQFDSKSEGKKNFTRVIKFDYIRGEQKSLTFSLDVEDFQKGNYGLQLWHKGVMIGKAFVGLN